MEHATMTQAHRFKIDKLIRDQLPQMMRASGIQVFEAVMEKDEYVKRLKDKLLEEAKEVIASASAEEVREELADVWEVMSALVKIYAMEWTDIQQAAELKRSKKGGFDGRVYVDSVIIASDHPQHEHYMLRPEQYPQEPV